MSNKSLLIVASLAYDGIETSEQKVDRTLGGAGSFICLSVKHFECNSSIVSVVGNDFHNEDLELLRSCGVDISGIEIIKDDKTFRKFIEQHKEKFKIQSRAKRYRISKNIEKSDKLKEQLNITEDELEDPALVRDMFREYLVS